MSYQQDIRDVLTSAVIEHKSAATFEVVIARPGSFEMKAILKNDGITHEHIFDLANGLTPRVRRSIHQWVALVLTGEAPAEAASQVPTDVHKDV